MKDQIEAGVKRLIGVPRHIHEAATKKPKRLCFSALSRMEHSTPMRAAPS